MPPKKITVPVEAGSAPAKKSAAKKTAAKKTAAKKTTSKKTTAKKSAPAAKQSSSNAKKDKLKILMISSEMVPFAKTGGLADVVGVLPAELKKKGHDVRVVIPLYSSIDREKYKIELFQQTMCVWMGNSEEWCAIYKATAKDGVTVYFIDNTRYFEREGLYHDDLMNDYQDNPCRFGFLSRAALQLCIDRGFKPDVVHVHDWQAALAPAYLKTWHWDHPMLSETASVLTIHNAAYQGVYPKSHYEYLGLGWNNFHADAFESFDRINFLKGGIYFADLVNTVSPGYAREISRPHAMFGLAPYLSNRGENFYGILNGVDYSEWSPENDPLIPSTYSTKDLSGKKECKRALQEKFGLEVNDKIPLFGAVGRFVEQKGYHLLAPAIEQMLQTMEAQFIILGSGRPDLQDFFGALPSRYPGKAASWIGYNVGLSHEIEAGCDFFLMPSLYEPCGLNQLYSLKYGTLPLVRATGGLDDTVVNYNEVTGEGTGFKFEAATVEALYNTIGWAVSTWYDRPRHIGTLRMQAMQQDYSWDKSTAEYEQAYKKAIENKKIYDSWHR